MIKMVVSDIDGTILEEGTDYLNPKMHEVIRRLREKGIIFVAASGRQYNAMRYVLKPVKDDVIFLAENGSVRVEKDEVLSYIQIEPEIAREVVNAIREYDDVEIVFSTPKEIYVEKEGYVKDMLENGYHNKIALTSDVMPFCENTNKITIYRSSNIEEVGEDMQRRFGDRLHVTISGAIWVDIMGKEAGKGKALERLQKSLGITPEETMAFGDNCNDISMLQRAVESYAVANAHPRLKEVAKYETASFEEEGVIQTIQDRLL